MPREHTGHSKHPLPTTQDKTLHVAITRWPTLKSDWLYSLSAKTRLGADYGSDHELLIAKFRFDIEDNISEDNKIDWEIKLLSRHGCN